MTNEDEFLRWKAFKQGDRTAYAELLDHYYPLLLHYGLRLNNDRHFVKDCLHDLFVEIWNQRERLDDVRSVKAYLLLSLRQKLIKERKRLSWFRNADEISDDYTVEVQFAIETYLVQHEVQHENLKKLQHHLERLTKRQREAIYLRFYQELEYDDIARLMAINYHSAVNLVYESLRMLRKNWFLTSAAAINVLSLLQL